ncbi:MAG: helix-turn-helix domain-containing protein [Flavobacteriia bacterium]|jgi:AraC family transcriptional activator of pobA
MKEKLPVLQIDSFIENKNSFYVNELAQHLRTNLELISYPHKHDFYLTVLFTKGKGIHVIDFECFDVNPGSVFFLKPGQSHYWELSKETDGYIFFHSDLSHNNYTTIQVEDFPFYSIHLSSPHLQLEFSKINKFENEFRNLLKEFRQNMPFKERKLTNLMDCIYIEFSRLYAQKSTTESTSKSNAYLKQLLNFEKLIDLHYKAEKSPSKYAERMHITAKHLNRIAQETLQKTSGEMISERVILEAKRLIANNSMSLSDIALELGYEEYSYFSRFFKKNTGETLINFRKRYQR